jgi:hypothetical protein
MNYFLFEGKKIVIINKELLKADIPNKMKVDFIILHKNTKVKIADLKNHYEFEWLIADRTNSSGMVRKWKQYALTEKVRFWDVAEDGAFVTNIHSVF